MPTAATPIGIRGLIAELTELPANPSVAVRVLRLLDDPRTDASRLGRLVETDPALAAHTLRLANAPIHGFDRRITSARHAVMVLGFELVWSLAALTAGGVLGGGRAATTPPGFWEHSLASAAGAMVVAGKVRASEGEACSAGLLHDLGSALQHRAAPAAYQAVIDAGAEGDDREAAERAAFELDHAEAGAAVLAAWSFPDELVAVLRDHHRLPDPTTPDLVLVVRAGEALADAVVGAGGLGEAPTDLPSALAAVGLEGPDVDVDALVAEVSTRHDALRAVLA